METLDDAMHLICVLKGEAMAMQAVITSVLKAASPDALAAIAREYAQEEEAARAVMLPEPRVGDVTFGAFQRAAQAWSSTLGLPQAR